MRIGYGNVRITLSDDAWNRVRASRQFIDDALAAGTSLILQIKWCLIYTIFSSKQYWMGVRTVRCSNVRNQHRIRRAGQYTHWQKGHRVCHSEYSYVIGLGAELRFHLGTHWICEQATPAECDPLARMWRWYPSGEGTSADALRASHECTRARLQWHLDRHAATLHWHLQRCVQSAFHNMRVKWRTNKIVYLYHRVNIYVRLCEKESRYL